MRKPNSPAGRLLLELRDDGAKREQLMGKGPTSRRKPSRSGGFHKRDASIKGTTHESRSEITRRTANLPARPPARPPARLQSLHGCLLDFPTTWREPSTLIKRRFAGAQPGEDHRENLLAHYHRVLLFFVLRLFFLFARGCDLRLSVGNRRCVCSRRSGSVGRSGG